jgi:hypothetical protein
MPPFFLHRAGFRFSGFEQAEPNVCPRGTLRGNTDVLRQKFTAPIVEGDDRELAHEIVFRVWRRWITATFAASTDFVIIQQQEALGSVRRLIGKKELTTIATIHTELLVNQMAF